MHIGGGFLVDIGAGTAESDHEGFCWSCLKAWALFYGNRRCGTVQSGSTMATVYLRELPLASLWSFDLEEGGRPIRNSLKSQAITGQDFS